MITKDLLDKLVGFRREIHMHPQLGFNQYQTRNRVKAFLKELAIKDQQFVEIAKTGLIVDICGEAPEQGQAKCIAFRADMDALSMIQTNDHLQYKSKNHGVAHMCGHDGHTACLVGFVALFINVIHKIPKNKTIRLLFQPSEQGPISGAKKMIQEGCLEGVDQIYGYHNYPAVRAGQIWCKEGPVMSQITIMSIKVIGTSGHGSQPETLKVAVWQGLDLYQKVTNYLKELKLQKKEAFAGTFPVFTSGQRYNVISQSAYMQGTIRSFQNGLIDVIIQKFNSFISQAKSKGFQVQFKHNTYAPVNINTKEQTEHVLRVSKKVFPQNKIGPGLLPVKPSQDFAYFTQIKPGAFFIITSAKSDNIKTQAMCHNSNYDFNDEIMQSAVRVWYQLALDRLGVKEQ